LAQGVYIGIDVGSVSTNVALTDENGKVLKTVYMRTRGQPIAATQEALQQAGKAIPEGCPVLGAGATGSARQLAGVVAGADVIKNEITAHAVASASVLPDVQTVIEIGGQDSKIIILRHGVIADFAMNTVCAAGTGSFLDQQAARLGIPIEEFGAIALKATSPVRIAGRCTVFAESDMVHKQQLGHKREDIMYGLCQALVRNYLNNVGRGKDIRPKVAFQGGVAGNLAIRKAFEEALQMEVFVPPYHDCMGALGAAFLAREEMEYRRRKNGTAVSSFRGFNAKDLAFQASSFECRHCPNHCEIIEIKLQDRVVGRWGSRCRRWEVVTRDEEGQAAQKPGQDRRAG